MATSTVYEPVMIALLAYLKGNIASNTFLTFQRGIIQWEMLAQTNNSLPLLRQPALFLYDGVMVTGGGTTKYEQRGRSRRGIKIIDRTIVIYAQLPAAGGVPGGQAGGPAVMTAGGGPILSPLVEAVENVPTDIPDSQGALTLGGLVSHCWLEGDGMWLTPDTDPNGQGMATLPVKIMVP